MQTWDAITSRRNVRSFADRPIAAADLDQILEAGQSYQRPVTFLARGTDARGACRW